VKEADTTHQNQTELLIRAYYEAFNTQDKDTVLSLLTDDITHDINQGPTETGKAAFSAFWDQMSLHYREKITNLIILTEPTATFAAAEFLVQGHYLSTAPGLPEAKSQPYTLPAATFFTIRDQKIARVTTYYNLPAWLAQVS